MVVAAMGRVRRETLGGENWFRPAGLGAGNDAAGTVQFGAALTRRMTFIARGADMTKTRNQKTAAAASKASAGFTRAGRDAAVATSPKKNGNGLAHAFSQAASRTAQLAGKPLTFLIAVGVVLVWAVSGPYFGFSDTWQLVINTSTTIVTFLMVFLIQNTQNRDTLALQLKLAELIIAVQGAKNDLATAEDLSEEDLERLHESYRKRAEETLAHLERRRGGGLKQAS
jgi:low affinity Fe/Cu permease